MKYGVVGDTLYFWFASNDTSGSGDDGATAVYDVREGGDTSSAIPTLSGSATLLTHANYPAGCYEVAVACTTGNGFSSDNSYGVFSTLAVDSQNPTGMVGEFALNKLATEADYGLLLETTIATLASQTSFTLTAGSDQNDAYNHLIMVIEDADNISRRDLVWASDYVGSTLTVTLDAGTSTFTAAVGDTVRVFANLHPLSASFSLQTGDSFARIGAAGAGLTDLGGMSTAMKAEVQTEANDALVANKLDHLVAVADADDPVDDSIIAKLASDTGDWSTYNEIQHSLKQNAEETIALQVTVGTAGAGLTDLGGMSTAMKAEINTEAKDVLNTDTYAEPGQEAPASTTSLANKINYLYKAWRNRSNQTATTYQLYNDDASTVGQKATVSDDATTSEKGEVGTGA